MSGKCSLTQHAFKYTHTHSNLHGLLTSLRMRPGLTILGNTHQTNRVKFVAKIARKSLAISIKRSVLKTYRNYFPAKIGCKNTLLLKESVVSSYWLGNWNDKRSNPPQIEIKCSNSQIIKTTYPFYLTSIVWIKSYSMYLPPKVINFL